MPDEKQMEFINKAYRFNSGIENRVVGKEHPYFNDVYKKKDIKIGMMKHCSKAEVMQQWGKVLISNFVDIRNMANFKKEFIAAEILAKKGYNIRMRPYHDWQKKGVFNLDYEIDGELFDLKVPNNPDNPDLFKALNNSCDSANDQECKKIVIDISNCTFTNMMDAYKLVVAKLKNPKTRVNEIILIRNGIAYKPIKGNR